MVCTGNSCRSIMAEGLLKKALKELGKSDIEVKSAGTGALDDAAPTRETIEAMRKVGIDVSDFRSKSLKDEDIIKADLILVMAAHHMDEIIRRVPEAVSKTHLLKQFGQISDANACEDLDIFDPIGRPGEDYERVLQEIRKEIKRVAGIL